MCAGAYVCVHVYICVYVYARTHACLQANCDYTDGSLKFVFTRSVVTK